VDIAYGGSWLVAMFFFFVVVVMVAFVKGCWRPTGTGKNFFAPQISCRLFFEKRKGLSRWVTLRHTRKWPAIAVNITEGGGGTSKTSCKVNHSCLV
jgi:hypothetical protein